MRAAVVTELIGPDGVQIRDIPEPEGDLIVDVHAVGISFPDLLLSKGEYQLKPEVPFTLGVDFAGVVRRDAGGFAAGDRVAGCLPYGGGAEVVASAPDFVFPLPDSISFVQGAALPMNYLTAEFALGERGQVQPGETVLVHGAAGGVGTATLQVARGMGARTIAVVSTEEKAEVARAAGADEVVLTEGFREAVQALGGADVVLDVVGADLFTDSLRCLNPTGRLLVVGFAGGSIPEVKVNRLLLNNIDVRGVGWGAYAMVRPGFMREQWQRLLPMLESGVIVPPVHDVRPIEKISAALHDMDQRRTLGKTVLTLT